MSTGIDISTRPPLIRLLDAVFDSFSEELFERLADSPYNDVRPGHGCVFGNIAPDGMRLTELAERAHMTKQSVGEVTSDLERRGYLERVPDPGDGRAKIIRLTERGLAAQAHGRRIIDDLEREWGERYGRERVAALRDALEVIAGDKLGWWPLADAGVPDAAGAGVSDAAGAGVPDAAGAGVPDASGAGVPDAAGAGVPDAAGAGVPDAAGAHA